MHRSTKSAIKTLVLDLRKLLEDDVEVVLKRYGIFKDRDWLPIEKVPKAGAQIRRERERMAAVIANEQARGISRGEATGWYIREVAFTYLNRLVGLKCLEVRGLIDEVITTRPEYGNRSLFHRDFRHEHPDLAAQADDALPEAFEAACRLVDEEMIGVLFDPDSEISVIRPRFRALRDAVGLINDLPRQVWAEDEIIGWIYQFYNTREKEAIRDRGRPQLPIEVAVINQFFTPRWIVKFLVDNTLGRLWLEMHPDSDRVRAKCDYLVPEPAQQQEEADGEDGSFRLDPTSPVNSRDAEPRRRHKSVTQLRLIDPACGTMHFGYYAFEVFQQIYRDARDHGWQIMPHPDSPPPSDAEVPALILAHNLYGVDIDLRAVQLAALSLYMKARVAEREVDPDYRAPDYRVNLVSADARLINGELRERFLEEYEDDSQLQKVWRTLFEEMEDIAQVGSLLRVEERLRQLLEEYQPQSLAKQKLGPRGEQEPRLGSTLRQLSLIEAPGGESWTPRRTLAEMVAHLRDFAREALDGSEVNAQLFAIEAEKTLGLLDVLLHTYSVVVMNPPYGATTDEAKSMLRHYYPDAYNDLYASFFARAIDLVSTHKGLIGALTSKTFLSLPSYQSLRENVILENTSPTVVLDLGFNILDDAVVDTAATVLAVGRTNNVIDFINLEQFSTEEKPAALTATLNGAKNYHYQPLVDDFRSLPKSPFAYWASHELVSRIQSLPPLDCDQTSRVAATKIADVKDGLSAGGIDRFVRNHWESLPGTVGRGRKWIPFAKGGDFSRFYSDVYLLVNWMGNGKSIRKIPHSRVQNEQFYFRQGITYPNVTVKGFSARYLPVNSIFSTAGQGIFLHDDTWLYPILAFLNSELAEGFLKIIGVKRHYNVGFVAHLPIHHELLGEHAQLFGNLAKQAHDIKAHWDEGNEISTRFIKPWVVQLAQQDDAFNHSLREILSLLDIKSPSPSADFITLLKYTETVEIEADQRLQELQTNLDEATYDLYEISEMDQKLIEQELGDRPPELVWPQMEGKSRKEKNREHVRRLLSYYILEAIKADADGILPVFLGTGEPTALERLRERLAAEFGEEAAFKLEDDAGKVLGRSVANWLDGQFIKWHTKLYNKRPIIWHIASPKNSFGVFVYIHKLDRDTLRKVRHVYLRTAREQAQAGLQRAREQDDQKTVSDQEDLLDELQILDERLESVINNQVGYKPPKWAEGPYRNGVYDPVIDDGVKVNLTPLQKGEVLRYKRMI